MGKKADDLRPLMMRLPEELWERLNGETKRSHRSMNAEIIHWLEQSFEYEQARQRGETPTFPLPPPMDEEAINEIARLAMRERKTLQG
jgi:hypothetical protein